MARKDLGTMMDHKLNMSQQCDVKCLKEKCNLGVALTEKCNANQGRQWVPHCWVSFSCNIVYSLGSTFEEGSREIGEDSEANNGDEKGAGMKKG